jgi:hypothetical protein
MIRIAGKSAKLPGGVFPDFSIAREDDMKRILPLVTATLLLSAGWASAAITTQKWTTGWDNFSEPLDLTHSSIKWSVSATRKWTVTFTLKGATPNKLYQVGVHIFCDTFPTTFGQFPVGGGGGACAPLTRQGVTKKAVAVEFGVVTTDIHGNGSFKVVVGPIVSGTYHLEFDTRNGAGCNLTGGGGANDPNICEADFQSPGPFGTATTVIVP